MKVDTEKLKEKILGGVQPILQQVMETEGQIQQKLGELGKHIKELPCSKAVGLGVFLDASSTEKLLDKLSAQELRKHTSTISNGLKSAVGLADSEQLTALQEKLSQLEKKIARIEKGQISKAQFQKLATRVDNLKAD